MTATPHSDTPLLGVVLVTFNSSDVILDCLESLLGTTDVRLAIAVIDNGSTDGTPELIRNWAAGEVDVPLDDLPFELSRAVKPLPLDTDLSAAQAGHAVRLLETGENAGFAGGVNRGLELLSRVEGCDRFWILNPDAVVPPGTALAFATHPVPEGGFSLMGGRVLYLENPDMIQIDGGTITRWSGITKNVNMFASHAQTPAPSGTEAMDFITGASMVASREFYEAVGPMHEDYFLYYEEVDWALRRGDLPMVYCPDGIVYHKGGTAIGSPTYDRPASPFSLYFKHRARRMFVDRHLPRQKVSAQAWTLAKATQYATKGFGSEARALLAGAFGAAPPQTVRERLSPEAMTRLDRH